MGSSNNPISGLTLTPLVVTALILVASGVSVMQALLQLGIAAIVRVSAAVAGEMLQKIKKQGIYSCRYLDGRMQIGDIIGVILAGSVMFDTGYPEPGNIAQGS